MSTGNFLHPLEAIAHRREARSRAAKRKRKTLTPEETLALAREDYAATRQRLARAALASLAKVVKRKKERIHKELAHDPQRLRAALKDLRLDNLQLSSQLRQQGVVGKPRGRKGGPGKRAVSNRMCQLCSRFTCNCVAQNES